MWTSIIASEIVVERGSSGVLETASLFVQLILFG